MDIWVQVHNFQSGFMSEVVAQTVGTYIGEFIKSDSNNYTGFWKEYMHVRVSIDVRQPLKKRMQLSKSENDWFWADFKYERLPTFCYFCGLLGHSDRSCSKLFDLPRIPYDKYPYEPWMHAEPKKPKQKGARWLRAEEDYRAWRMEEAAGLHGEQAVVVLIPVEDSMNFRKVDRIR